MGAQRRRLLHGYAKKKNRLERNFSKCVLSKSLNTQLTKPVKADVHKTSALRSKDISQLFYINDPFVFLQIWQTGSPLLVVK